MREFQVMVKTLHAAGIEVILDVVYNHTAEGNELADTVDLEIPRCVDTIEEAIALIPENRTAWLATQKAK